VPSGQETLKRREEKRQALKEHIEDMLKEQGVSLTEIFPPVGKIGSQAKEKRKGAERKVKYRNPSDSSQTWTGTGRKPAWVIQALSSGKTLEDLTV
jgi:DNA-binding protein H-NS